ATEEQFYILAPLLLFFFNRYFLKKSLASYRNVLIFIFFVPAIARFITWDLFLGLKNFEINNYLLYIYRPFHNNCEGLIAGMIISNFYYDENSFFKRGLKFPAVLWTSGLLLFLLSFLSKIYWNFTGVAFGFGVLLIYTLMRNGWPTNFLSHRFFYPISKTSFAIYLIHYHVIYNLVPIKLIKKMSLGFGNMELIAAFIYVLITCIFISILLHILIEKPFMILREKFLEK
ncbi:MAG: hypothetical protein H7336_11045, partial [Bacteriovorax sp.]|nr:hypothetical protein [Bacteriovorax sp.]